MAKEWPKGGGKVATYPRTHGRTNVPPTAGASATSRNQRGAAQAAVVVAFYRAVEESGQKLVGDPSKTRGMLAGQAGKLLDDGWPLEAILRAVDRFARRRLYAGHLAEWVRTNAADERIAVHEDAKKANRKTVRNDMRGVFQAIEDLKRGAA